MAQNHYQVLPFHHDWHIPIISLCQRLFKYSGRNCRQRTVGADRAGKGVEGMLGRNQRAVVRSGENAAIGKMSGFGNGDDHGRRQAVLSDAVKLVGQVMAPNMPDGQNALDAVK
jgi:hypothetical protein